MSRVMSNKIKFRVEPRKAQRGRYKRKDGARTDTSGLCKANWVISNLERQLRG